MSKLAKALSASAGNAGGDKLYVEDVFSTYVYTGNGSARSINNGIDLSGESGLVWIKNRTDALSHMLSDTVSGANKQLNTNTTNAQGAQANILTAFNSNGFTIGTDGDVNASAKEYVSWSFRKAEKFFDVVTYTGNAVNGRQIAHNLGSTPGMIVVKRINGGTEWPVYHESTGAGQYLFLSTTDQKSPYDGPGNTNSRYWNNTAPTSTNFSVSNDGWVNASDGTYVAYLFASDAGGFGDDEDENIIKCGSYTTDSSGNASVTLGFEPQWVLNKTSSYAASWSTVDMMRGFDTLQSNGYNQAPVLSPNTSSAENVTGGKPRINATGFTVTGTTASQTFIYMAIRRPMKTPEAGTEVFSVSPSMSGSVQPAFDAPHVCDVAFQRRPAFTQDTHIASRLTGNTNLYTNDAAAEVNQVENVWDFMDGWGGWTGTNTDYRAWNFKRATGFMDVVCYTGTGSATSFNHGLGVIPLLQIIKRRDSTSSWYVNAYDLSPTSKGFLNAGNNFTTNGVEWSGSNATTFSVYSGGLANINISGATYVNYLFATVAGVSKVGSYTGTGSDLNVDCGFTGGARFILIKRTDSTGDWYYWDYLRGITAGNDPYLLINSSAAEVTNTDYIDPLNAGFTVTSSAPAGLNASSGNYIFLAIA